MGVKEIGEKYRCRICGNGVIVTTVGGGNLVCCGKPMELMEGLEEDKKIVDRTLASEEPPKRLRTVME